MKILGNIIWLVFGGLGIAVEYFVSSLLLMITIIGIPFGIATLRLGILALWPFGSHVVDQPQDGGCLSLFMNRMNSESHQACLNGRVVNEEDDSQHSLVLCRWLLDCLDSSWLWFAPMHHHCRHSLGQDALPADAPGIGTIRKGNSQQRFLR